jgi:hypothetical protein
MTASQLPQVPLEQDTRAVLKLSEVARYLGIKKGTLVQRMRQSPDWIEVVRIGNLWYVRTESLRKALGVELRQQGGAS